MRKGQAEPQFSCFSHAYGGVRVNRGFICLAYKVLLGWKELRYPLRWALRYIPSLAPQREDAAESLVCYSHIADVDGDVKGVKDPVQRGGGGHQPRVDGSPDSPAQGVPARGGTTNGTRNAAPNKRKLGFTGHHFFLKQATLPPAGIQQVSVLVDDKKRSSLAPKQQLVTTDPQQSRRQRTAREARGGIDI